jgi:hypothetical protein
MVGGASSVLIGVHQTQLSAPKEAAPTASVCMPRFDSIRPLIVVCLAPEFHGI